MGRPTLPNEKKRSNRVSVSFTNPEFDLIKREHERSEINELARFIALATLGAEIREADILPEINSKYLHELKLLREAAENLGLQIEDLGADYEALESLRQLTVAVQAMAVFVTSPHSYNEVKR